MELPLDTATEMSQTLVGLAADMASFKNISIDRAQTALNAVYTGETESLKELGVVMTPANLEAYAMSKMCIRDRHSLSGELGDGSFYIRALAATRTVKIP